MNSTAVWVDDMYCSACSNKIEQALGKLQGVEQVRINPIDKQIHVTHAADLLSKDIVQSIESAGFHPKLAALRDDSAPSNADLTLLKRTGVAGICMMQIMMLQIALYAGAFDTMSTPVQSMLSYVALLFCVPVVSYAAIPFFIRGLIEPTRSTTNLLYALDRARLWCKMRHLNGGAPVCYGLPLAVTRATVVGDWQCWRKTSPAKERGALAARGTKRRLRRNSRST